MKILPFILMAVILTSCYSSIGDSALVEPYQESCQLTEHDLDSVQRFDVHFHADYPVSQYGEDELYDQIEGNVERAKKYFTAGFTFSIDSTWADSTIIHF